MHSALVLVLVLVLVLACHFLRAERGLLAFSSGLIVAESTAPSYLKAHVIPVSNPVATGPCVGIPNNMTMKRPASDVVRRNPCQGLMWG